MLTSATAVIERRTEIAGDHVTHPYEAGWASEALFFLQVPVPHPEITVQVQTSPDGITWVNRGKARVMHAHTDIIELGLERFGGWLRLALSGPTPESPATILVHLAMKG